jgi:type IV pilus assembly protein PilY1
MKQQKHSIFAWLSIIMLIFIVQTKEAPANIIDDIRNATIPFVGIKVDFEGTGVNHPQPTFAEGAKWNFESTDAGQSEYGLESGQTFEVKIGTAIDNSFIMAVLEYFLNAIISTLNWVLNLIGINIPAVDFSFKYSITFSDIDGWQKPGRITSYITLVKFKPIQYKPFCIDYWWCTFRDGCGWKKYCINVPIQFGMSHKATYIKLQQKCYKDADGDTYGDNKVYKDTFEDCTGEWVEDNTDCDDTDALINPGIGEETRCNLLDDDCDGEKDEGLRRDCYKDFDSDGCGDPSQVINYCISEGPPTQCVDSPCDCDESDPDRFAGNPEIKCDGKDQDCNDEDDCPGEDCLTISDIPLETLADPAPPLIVFVLDDSGSMDWDIMTHEMNGTFYPPTGGLFYYVFYAPENKYRNVQENSSVLNRYYYQTQNYEYNRIYYNPSITYEPWPKWHELPGTPTPSWAEVPNANPRSPRSDPMLENEIDLNGTYVTFGSIQIKRAHYYIFSKQANKLYLVNIDIANSSIDYYYAKTKANHQIKALIKKNNPPTDVRSSRTFEEELQNFANWFSFYRKRMLTAKAAIGNAIASLEGIKVGLLTINNNKSARTSVLPIKCKNDAGSLDDQTDAFLSILYKADSYGGTPLRRGLENAGKYFDETRSSPLGNWPYASEAEGGECQQVFSVVLTDGWWNGGAPSVGNADESNSSEFSTACFSDSYRNTLADVAMFYYANDLSPSLENKVPPRPGDSNIQQHMVTFSVSFGQTGTLNPFDDYPSCPAENKTIDCSAHCPEWPRAQANSKTTIDDLWHSAVNGRGEFFSASNPQDLIHAMESIGRQISVIGSAASVAVNGQKFESNSLVFQGSYNSSDWSGDINAFGTGGSGGSGGSDNFDYDNPVWSARDKLDAKDWEDRVIITSSGGSGGILFKNVSGDLLKRINEDEDIARRIIRYIRGDDTEEQKNGGIARTRYHKLGDIVHSQPLFYRNYVFIGANDGMGHVFNSDTGEEIAAYIPNLVFENLIYLCLPDYTHYFYCDATPTIKKAGSDTYLVGGLGKGGRGYYCLMVSAGDYTHMPKWEFPPYTGEDADDDVEMGYSYGTPYITNTNANEWVAIFGNGYASKRGKAALYIRKLSNGEKIATLDTQSGSYDICNGLSTPSLVDANFDDKVDYVYAGDMIGNMWKFDLTSDKPEEWKVAYGSFDEPQPLFQARNAEGSEGTPQPITSKPDVMAHCVHGKSGYIVVFGTGRYITEGDTKSMNQQTIYGIWDWQNDERNEEYFYGAFTKERELSNARTLPEEYRKIKLLEQEIDTGYTSDGYRVMTDKTITWFPSKIEDEDDYSHVGWYFDLPTQHERVIDNPMIREGKVIVISLVPSSSKCGIKSHSSMYLLDACNGGRLNEPVVNIDGEIVEIEPDIPGNPKRPPSVIIFDTVIKPPAFIHTDDGTDKMVFGDLGSDNTIPDIEIDSEQGRYYWKY